MGNILKNYSISELPEGIFPITSKIRYCYQWKDPRLIAKHKCEKYKSGFSLRQ